MNRRSFTRRALTALVVPPVSARLALAQQVSMVEYGYVEFANALVQALLGVTRETKLASRGARLADTLLRAVSSAVPKRFAEANKSLKMYSDLTAEMKVPLSLIAEKKRLRGFAVLWDVISDGVPADMRRWIDKQSELVLPVPRQLIRCVLSCVLDQEACLGPLLKGVISCAVGALPVLSRGPQACIVAFGGCLLQHVPDLTSDLIVDCLPRLEECIIKCSGPQ